LPKVEWEKEALEDLPKIDKPIVKRILNKISWFSQHFDNITPESLSGDCLDYSNSEKRSCL